MATTENTSETKSKPVELPRPLGAFRFEIRMDMGSTAMAGFTQFSGVKMKVDTLQARSGNDIRGVQEYVPIMTRYEPVTLSKGVIGNNIFLAWLFDAAAGMESGPMVGSPRTLNVVVKDETGEDAAIWVLKDAIPIAYELSPMDGGRSGLLSENLTFAIQGVQRVLVKDPVNKDAGNAPNPKRVNPDRKKPGKPIPPNRLDGEQIKPRKNPPRPNPDKPTPPKRKAENALIPRVNPPRPNPARPAPPMRKAGNALVPRVNPPRPDPQRPAPPRKKSDFIS